MSSRLDISIASPSIPRDLQTPLYGVLQQATILANDDVILVVLHKDMLEDNL